MPPGRAWPPKQPSSSTSFDERVKKSNIGVAVKFKGWPDHEKKSFMTTELPETPAKHEPRGRSINCDSEKDVARRMRCGEHQKSPETAYRLAVQDYLSAPVNICAVAHRSVRSVSPPRSKWCTPEYREDSGNFSEQEVGGAGSGVTRSTQAEGTDKSARVPPLLLRPNGWGVDAKGEWTPLEGHRAVRAVGRVPLTWTDSRGNTLAHLAAIYNDIALLKKVLDCERRRKGALEVRTDRRDRVLERAKQWRKTDLKEVAAKKLLQRSTAALSIKEIRRRIKEQQAMDDTTTIDDRRTASPGSGDGEEDDATTVKDSQVILSPYVAACRNWMSLDPDGDGCGENGREVVARLRGVLEEERLLKVLRLAGMYCEKKLNEADWYHRTGLLLPGEECRDLLVAIADTYPTDTWDGRLAKAAIKDYAEEERSGTDGTYWMDRGIQAALDLNARNRLGETALILGAQRGSREVVVGLLEEKETDITATNVDGGTALVVSAIFDREAVAKSLIAACRARRVGVNQRTENGYSALHWAAVRGNYDLAIDLIDAGAAVNEGRTERESLGRLPIHKCAEYGSTACLEILLKAGADPLLEDKLGMTAMHIAASKGFVDMMRVLMCSEAPGVSVSIISKKTKKPPLHFAVECFQLEAARFILANSPEGEEIPRKLLDATQRAKLEVMLAAAEKEERGVVASAAATLSEFFGKIF